MHHHQRQICRVLTTRSLAFISSIGNNGNTSTTTRTFQDSFSNLCWMSILPAAPLFQKQTLSRGVQSGIPRSHDASTSPPPFVTTCWKCEAEVRTPVTSFPGSCAKCGRVPKYTVEQIPDYFTLLGQSKQEYNVDLASLSLNMKKLQRQLHPDLFSNSEEEEQEVSQNLSSIVNQAIVTLQNPIERGIYLLRLRGVSPELEKQQTQDPAFLGEVMELNEELENLASPQQWKKFRSRNEKELRVLETQLGKAFEHNDLHQAQLVLYKMKYYENLKIKLKQVQSKFNVVD